MPNEKWLPVVLLLLLWLTRRSRPTSTSLAQCPTPDSLPGCSCYNFADGLFVECTGPSEDSLRLALQRVVGQAKSHVPIQSLSIHELDAGLEELRATVFPEGARVRHLQIAKSGLRELSEAALERLAEGGLESLSLTSSRLAAVPQKKALASLGSLTALDLEANRIGELPSYGFYGLKLVKLSLKANRLAKMSEYAFAGLESSLAELDLTENKLRLFPMTALRRLERLDSLRLAWNDVSALPDDGHSRLGSLLVLDLSGNEFRVLPLNCFRCCPALRVLALHYNGLEDVDKDAFISLRELESIDLSHNKIVFLDPATFRANQRLRSVELSHNHIHYVGGAFARLPELRELYLAENNVLELPADAFAGSGNLAVLHLQQNAIRRVDASALRGLHRLEQLHLTANYLERLPTALFEPCASLASLSLDANRLRELEPGTFAPLERLRELRLQNNILAEVRRGVFAPLPGLQELYLQNNAITDVETGALRSLHRLQHIDLQGNQLAVLSDVFHPESSGSSSLLSLQLDNNGLALLGNDSLRGQASLRAMWLGHNRLTRLQAPLFRDLRLVERLYLNNNSIARIDDGAFRPMQALKYLDLSQNRLTEVGVATFAELRDLEELHLRANALKRLDAYALTALKRLRVLDLSSNPLKVLYENMFQEGLPIRTLSLRNCSLDVIERGAFRGLNNLVELNLESNQLSATAFERLDVPGLRVLMASGNNLSLVAPQSLAGLPSLQQLVLDGARIARLPAGLFTRPRNLARLLLGDNLLSDLPELVGLESLRELRLDGNRFRETPYAALGGAKALEILSLARNDVTKLNVASLAELDQLRELDLSHNRIEFLSGSGHADLPRLISVDLSHNRLSALPANFFARSPMLRRVDLSENRFRQVPAVALSGRNLPGLTWLNLTRNPLGRIHELPSEASYPLLQEIHISQTNLTILTSQDFEAFPELLHLYLSQNGISRISPGAFRGLPNLLTLHLGTNSLELLPQERLRGLEHLRILNLTRNRLKELEEFPEDLKALQILDLSFNQIGAVDKVTLKNLANLVELHLYGNRISAISSEAFRPLKKLRLLDLSRNFLENLPLNAFRPLETQIRSLRAEENPLHCGCQSQELWEWLRDHRKLIGGQKAGLLRCEQPPELRGSVFLELDRYALCSMPLIAKLVVQDIQPFSVLVSWQSRNHSNLQGYQVALYALSKPNKVLMSRVLPSSHSLLVDQLQPNTRYRLCVKGLTGSADSTAASGQLAEDPAKMTTRCTEAATLALPDAVASSDVGSGRTSYPASSVLTRRLGLIIGCCMGFVVFLLLISVLGYLKVKKQREAAKRDKQSMPNEYISYRQFSMQSAEAGQLVTKQLQLQQQQQQQRQTAPSVDGQTQPPSFTCGATPTA